MAGVADLCLHKHLIDRGFTKETLL